MKTKSEFNQEPRNPGNGTGFRTLFLRLLPGFLASRFLLPAFLLSLFIFSSCASDGTSTLTPAQRAALSQVELTALNTAVSVGTQYAVTRQVDTSALIINSIDGAAGAARTLISTPAAADPVAIKEALQSGSNSPAFDAKIAPPVADAVSAAITKGAPPDAAVEAAARGLNKAAAKVRKK